MVDGPAARARRRDRDPRRARPAAGSRASDGLSERRPPARGGSVHRRGRRGVPTHIIVHRSRFEFDLNRAASDAVYRTPEQSWGLEVWQRAAGRRSWSQARSTSTPAYYRMLGALLDGVAARHERFVLLDVHSYNHRRDGPDGAADAAGRGAGHQHRHLLDAARANGPSWSIR